MGQSLVRGTLVLTTASVITRFIGLAYRVYLVRLAGPEVIGLFQMIFPLYFTLIVLASAGLPLAISKMVADRVAMHRPQAIARVMGIASWTSVIAGCAVTLLLFASARAISYSVLKDSRTFIALLVVAPGLPAISLSATLKGYFQGMSDMTPVARSQVVEQLVHVGATIALVMAYKSASDGAMAAVLAVGSLAGDMAGLAYILRCYRVDRRGADASVRKPRASTASEPKEDRLKLVREMATLAVPVTAGRLIVSLNAAVNAALIPGLLRAGGLTLHQSTVAFAELTGMAMNLVTIPTVFTASMASTLVPSVAYSQARGLESAVGRRAWQSLKLTLVVGTFFASVFLALGRPMCLVLFRSAHAGALLTILAPGALAMYTQHVLSGVLQGLNRPTIPMASSLVSTACSTAGLYLFVGRLGMGIDGAALTISVGMAIGSLICFISVKRLLDIPAMSGLIVQVLICGLVGGAVACAAHSALLHVGAPAALALLGAFCAAASAYAATVLMMRLASVTLVTKTISRMSRVRR